MSDVAGPNALADAPGPYTIALAGECWCGFALYLYAGEGWERRICGNAVHVAVLEEMRREAAERKRLGRFEWNYSYDGLAELRAQAREQRKERDRLLAEKWKRDRREAEEADAALEVRRSAERAATAARVRVSSSTPQRRDEHPATRRELSAERLEAEFEALLLSR